MAVNRITGRMLGTPDDGDSDYILTTDGNGNISWTSPNSIAGITLQEPTDGSLYPTGAINNWASTTLVTDAVDDLNELALNIMNNTAVADVNFAADYTEGGAGLAVTLTITASGNPTHYNINWGDGNTTTGTTDSTPTHTYLTNVDSPYDVTVTAYNSSGDGTGSDITKLVEDYITIYTADPVVTYNFYRSAAGGSALTGNNLYVIEGDSLYMENSTTNIGDATVDYTMSWGDSNTTDITTDLVAGGTQGARLEHNYADGTASSTNKITTELTLNDHSTATPSVTPTSDTVRVKVYEATPTPPNGLSTKTISFSGSEGTLPRLAAGFTDNTSGTSYIAGDDVLRTAATVGTVDSSETLSYAYNAVAGILSASVNGNTSGTQTLSANTAVSTNASLSITAVSDYNLLDANGSSVTFDNSIYYPGAFTGFKAKVSADASNLSTGVNNFQLAHSTTGNTNVVEFVKDDLLVAPTVVVTGAAVSESNAGTYRYISGVPYYNTGSPTITVSGVAINNLVGQCYTNQDNIVEVSSGTNSEGTSADPINEASYTYAQIDGASTMLTSGIPNVNVGTSTAYSIGNLVVPVSTQTVRTIGQIYIRARNVVGVGNFSTEIPTQIQVHTASQTGVVEFDIPVSTDLGNGVYTDNGKRIFDLAAETTETPVFNSLTNYYTNSVYSESSDPGVAGTQEATVRLGILKHFTEDLSTGYLPTGPNRSADTGRQYFTFAFRRQAAANFSLNLVSSTGVAGVWIAAPSTAVDTTSTINGWLDASTQYAGSGVPGADTSNGGNGSNGCAFTGGDIITPSTSLNNWYTMTLGSENMSNATGNVVLVRIALDSGDSITTIAVGEG